MKEVTVLSFSQVREGVVKKHTFVSISHGRIWGGGEEFGLGVDGDNIKMHIK
jgi:hypothetical protein